ncbi:unnamed protein product, partial [Cuscuta europaea]
MSDESVCPTWEKSIAELRDELRDQATYNHHTAQALQRTIQDLAHTIEKLQFTAGTSTVTPSSMDHTTISTARTLLPKIALPTFDGTDPHNWIFQAQEYFEYHKVSEAQRLSFVSFMMEREASEWLRWMKNNNLLRTWTDFLEQLKQRFDPAHFEDFVGKLSKTRQLTTVAAYRADYEKLLNKVTGVPETILISMFVASLQSTIGREVQRAKPDTLIQAFALASEIEAQHGDLYTSFKSSSHSNKPLQHMGPNPSPSTLTTTSNPSRLNLARQNTSTVAHQKKLPIIQISPAEKQAKFEKGECYTCNQKWSRNHKCLNRALLLMCSEDD